MTEDDIVLADLTRDEEKRNKVYDDATGKPLEKGSTVEGFATVGIGRNLVTKGLSDVECVYLARNDIAETKAALDIALPWFSTLDLARRRVLINMAFNNGVGGLLAFHKMLTAVQASDHLSAAAEILDSKMAKEEPARAKRLHDLMLS